MGQKTIRLYTFTIYFLVIFFTSVQTLGSWCEALFNERLNNSYVHTHIKELNHLITVIAENNFVDHGEIDKIFDIIEGYHPTTRFHSERVAEVAQALAQAYNLSSTEILKLKLSASIHDVGKLVVPLSILDGDSKLTELEIDIIHHHSEDGYQLITSLDAYPNILEGVLHHHEKFSGGGYPSHKIGKNIPLFGRIIQIADIFDAITVRRSYKPAHNPDDTIKLMDELNSKGEFDPELYSLFKTIVFPKLKAQYEPYL